MFVSMDFFLENPTMSSLNPNPDPLPNVASQGHGGFDPCGSHFCPNHNTPIASPFEGSHHQRSPVEEDFHPVAGSYHGYGGEDAVASVEESRCDDDPVMNYIDFSMIENDSAGGDGSNGDRRDKNADAYARNGDLRGGDGEGSRGGEQESNGKNLKTSPLHHQRSCSMGVLEVLEPKKATPADKIAELWITDPKRAKRIMANRQSAARSKEKKARYIAGLEKKVYTLQNEAGNLLMQLSMYQREATNLASENTELKLRLQAMEHQAKMRDDLNDALKREVNRLTMTTGEERPASQAVPRQPHNTHLFPDFLIDHDPLPSC